MKKLLWTGCAACLACIAIVAAAMAVAEPADNAGKTAIQVVGLQVVRPLGGDKREQSLTGRKTGTLLTLRASRPDKHFLGVDDAASKLEAFTDDKDTELVGESAALLRTWLDGDCWVSPDGKDCLFDVRSWSIPARDARQVILKASIVLKYGRDGTTDQQANFRLEKDNTLKAGPATFTVTGVQHGDKTAIVTLSTKDSIERIASIRFFGPDGKELDTKLMDKATVGFMGSTFYDRTYCLKTDKPVSLDAVTVRVHHFRRVERITVPVSVTAGVGL